MINYRRVLELYFENVSQRTISSGTGHSRNTVSNIVHRHKKMDYMRESTPNNILDAFYKRHTHLKKIKVHGFRHTHASLLFEAGASLKDVQARLGHGDIQTTMNIYTHVTSASRERVANMFQNYMDF